MVHNCWITASNMQRNATKEDEEDEVGDDAADDEGMCWWLWWLWTLSGGCTVI